MIPRQEPLSVHHLAVGGDAALAGRACHAPNGKGGGVGLMRGLLRPESWMLGLVGLLWMVWIGALAGPVAGELVLAQAHGGALQGVKRGSIMLGGVHG